MELNLLIKKYNDSLEALASDILSFKITQEDINVHVLQEIMENLGVTLNGRKQSKNIKSNLRDVYDQYTLELEKKVAR